MATNDKACSIVPYFKVAPGKLDEFRALCERFVERTQSESKVLFYGFSIAGDIVHCRECYADAEGMLAHLENVGDLVAEALKISELIRFELHGPADELEKVKGPLADLNPEYYALEYGFRR